jgi:hypothetical protein
MNESEMLVELASQFHKVGIIEDAESSPSGKAIRMTEGLIWKRVAIYEKSPDGDILSGRKVLYYYVQDVGKVTERVFWQDRLPEKQFGKIVPVDVDPKPIGLMTRIKSVFTG